MPQDKRREAAMQRKEDKLAHEKKVLKRKAGKVEMRLHEVCKAQTHHRMPEPEIPSPQLETRNPKLENRSPKPETQHPKPETLNPEPSTLNPQPSTLNYKP